MDVIKINDTDEKAVIIHKEKQIGQDYYRLNTALIVDPDDHMRYVCLMDNQFTKIGEIND